MSVKMMSLEEYNQDAWKLAWSLFTLSVMSFIAAGLYSAFVSDVGIVSLLNKNISLLGSCVFGPTAIAFSIATKIHKMNFSGQVSTEEKEKDEIEFRKINGVTIFLFIFFGISLASDDWSWATSANIEKTFDYFISVMFVGAGLIFLFFSLLTHKISEYIWENYLNKKEVE